MAMGKAQEDVLVVLCNFFHSCFLSERHLSCDRNPQGFESHAEDGSPFLILLIVSFPMLKSAIIPARAAIGTAKTIMIIPQLDVLPEQKESTPGLILSPIMPVAHPPT